jgi:hypothetical protein
LERVLIASVSLFSPVNWLKSGADGIQQVVKGLQLRVEHVEERGADDEESCASRYGSVWIDDCIIWKRGWPCLDLAANMTARWHECVIDGTAGITGVHK